MTISIKKALLTGTALVAVGAFALPALAAPTELAASATVAATDANGVTETTGSNTVTVDVAGGNVTLGADGTNSVIMNAAGGTLTINVDTSGAANTLTFADDIVETAGNIAINIVDTATVFQGSVSDSPITVGSSSANPTVALTVDTANNENITFDASISAVDAADTVNLTVTNTDGGANTVVFSADLGGASSSTALDAITLGADTTDPLDVTFEGDVNAATIAIGTGNGANATSNVRFGAASTSTEVTGVISGGGAGDTNNVVVVGDANVTFNSAFGANIDAITIGADNADTSATFMDDVASGPITIGAGAGTVDTNTVTLDSTNGDFTVTPAIAGGHANDTNALVVNGGNTVTVTGAIGAGGTIDTVTLSGSGTELSTGGALTATTVTVGGSTTLTAGGTVTGAVNISGANGVVALGDGIDVTGTIDNTSGSNGRGTLTVTDAAGGTVSQVTGNVGATNSLSAVNLTGAGTAQFDGTVAATTITASVASGTLDFNGNVTGNVNLSADATVDLAATKSITGAINNTSGADGAGSLTIATTGGTNTISGKVGNSNSLKQATINGTGTAAFSSTVNVDDFDLGGAATVTFAADVTSANGIDLANNNGTFTFADGADLTGSISSTGGANGTLNFTGSSTVTGQVGLAAGTRLAAVNINGADKTVTITGNSFATAVTTVADSTLDLGGNLTLTGALTNDGSINVAVGKTLTAVGFGGAGSYNIAVADDGDGTLNAADFGSLNGGGGAINLAAETVQFNFTGQTATGAAVVLGTGGAASTTAATVTDNSFLYDAALAANGNNLELTVTRALMESASGTSNGQSVGAVLDDLVGTTNTELALVEDQIAQAGSQSALDEVLEATTPTVDAGAVVASLTVGEQTVGLTETRLASLRSEDDVTGMAAGNMGRGLRVWGQGFGQTADQDRRDGIDGYNSDTYGAAFGLDTENISDSAVLGVALSYANTDVDSDNANNTQTDVDSYGITLYGDYDLGEQTFISGQAGYAHNTIDHTRYDVGGVSDLNASADYDSDQFNVKGKVGRSYATDGGLTLTPNLSAAYTHVSVDDYTETGAGGANLHVNSDSLNILDLGVGVDASWMHQNADGSYIKPVLKAGYRYDVIGDKVETTSNFTGGGAAFKTEGFDPARSKFNVGAGLTYYTTTNWELSANYDFEIKADYDAHSGILRAGYKF